jgi:hypothetical protein
MNIASLTLSIIEDLRLAASNMTGAIRRTFQATMTEKYCNGSARLAEKTFGWNRNTVKTGLAEKRTGITCAGSQSAFSGNKTWEEKHPEIAETLHKLAEEHSQQDPTFKTTLSYTRLTAKEALSQLRTLGYTEEQLPSQSSMSVILNRMGYRLRKVVKAKPQKKIPETDAIFNNVQEKDAEAKLDASIKRLSIDCKATVKIGEYSRGGETRGDNEAADHDMGCTEKYTPFGILDENNGQLNVTFGSSCKTSDFIVDNIEEWWNDLNTEEQQNTTKIQIKLDNGPEISGVRTQFLNRIVEFSDTIRKPIQLLYYPPYHSKYNPIERCWGVLELHWNGAKLIDANTMIEWAKSMTWKGISPIIKLTKKVYKKGVTLTKKAMEGIEARLKRNPLLPKWDILVQPI